MGPSQYNPKNHTQDSLLKFYKQQLVEDSEHAYAHVINEFGSEEALSLFINSPAFLSVCFDTRSGNKTLALDNFKLSLLIKKESTNEKATHLFAGYSYLISLMRDDLGLAILAAHNYRLANMITPAMLLENTKLISIFLTRNDISANLLCSAECQLINNLNKELADLIIKSLNSSHSKAHLAVKKFIITSLQKKYFEPSPTSQSTTTEAILLSQYFKPNRYNRREFWAPKRYTPPSQLKKSSAVKNDSFFSTASSSQRLTPSVDEDELDTMFLSCMQDFGFDQEEPPILNEDNMETTFLSSHSEHEHIPTLQEQSASSSSFVHPSPNLPSIAPITMHISPKYMPYETTTWHKKNLRTATDTSAVAPTPKAKIAQSSLANLIFSEKEHQLTLPTPVKSDVMALDFYCAYSKSALTPEEHCFFIMAGRGENALVPSIPSHSRVIIVCTKDEYTSLNAHRSVQEYFDFLVINGINAPLVEQTLTAITTRRRAALHFAYVSNLSSFVMMDDNIAEFILPAEFLVENNADFLFNYLIMQQQKMPEPILSISTLNPIRYFNSEHALGSKVFLIDMHKLKSKLPQEPDLLALLPASSLAWGEDYFMQISTHILFRPQQNGFAIIDAQSLQLARSKKNINAYKSLNIKAACLDDLSDAIEQVLTSAQAAKEAISLFNVEVNNSFRRHAIQEQQKKEYDFAQEHAHTWGYNPEAIDTISSPNQPYLRNFITSINRLLVQNTLNKPFYPHQEEALKFLAKQLGTPKEDSAAEKNRLEHYVFNMATGAGKTLLEACFTIQSFMAAPQKNVLVICPSIALVHQTRAEFMRYGKEMLPELHQNQILPRILAVCTNEISIDCFKDNLSLNNRAHIFIMCSDSARALLEIRSEVFKNTSLIIYDESHLVVSDEHLEAITTKLKEEHYSTPLRLLHFSATPKPLQNVTAEFNFTRQAGIYEGILAPLLVDDSIESTLSSEQIAHALQYQNHPNGGILSEHKGVIYVNSIESANKLFEELKENTPSLNLFLIHSKNKKTIEQINQFRKASNGIAIAIEMLVEGFDDCKLDWAIINKKTIQPAARAQIVGRLIRKDSDNINKIGLVLLSKAINSIAPEQTTFPISLQDSYEYETLQEQLNELACSNTKTPINKYTTRINTNISALNQVSSLRFFTPIIPSPNSVPLKKRSIQCLESEEPRELSRVVRFCLGT